MKLATGGLKGQSVDETRRDLLAETLQLLEVGRAREARNQLDELLRAHPDHPSRELLTLARSELWQGRAAIARKRLLGALGRPAA